MTARPVLRGDPSSGWGMGIPRPDGRGQFGGPMGGGGPFRINNLVGWGGPGRAMNAPPKGRFGGYSPPTMGGGQMGGGPTLSQQGIDNYRNRGLEPPSWQLPQNQIGGQMGGGQQGFMYDPSAGNYSNNVPGSLGGPPAGGGGQMGGRQQNTPWSDPRRMARDPRLARGTHPQSQGGMSPYRNALMMNMQDFRGGFGVPQQGYRTGRTYQQGAPNRWAPPSTAPRSKPTAPPTMRGRGRMY